MIVCVGWGRYEWFLGKRGLCLGGGMGYNEGEENLRANHSGQKKKEIGLCSLIEYGFSQI